MAESSNHGEFLWRGVSRAARKRPTMAAVSSVVRRKPNCGEIFMTNTVAKLVFGAKFGVELVCGRLFRAKVFSISKENRNFAV